MKLISKIMLLKDKDSKIVINNVINTLFIKGGGIIVGLLTTPAYMRYFNENMILGLWFAMLSVLTWILSFDLGIGNGLRNKLVSTFISNDKEGTKKYISSAYIFLTFISIIIGIIITLFSSVINWNLIFNISTNVISEGNLRIAVIIVLLSILVQFVLRVITSILYALQKAFIPNLLILITNIILLIYVLISNYTGNNNNIIRLAVAYLIAVNLPLLLTTIIVFKKELNYAKPSKKYFNKNYAIDTVKVGGAFLIIQIEAMIVNNTSIFLITSIFGSERVVEYNVYFKIFSMVNTFFALLTVPIWSAVTKAIVEKRYVWIKKTTRVLQIVAIIFAIGQFLVFPIMQFVFNIWLGDQTFKVNYMLMIFFAFEQIIMIWSNLNAVISNGLNELKLQSILMGIGSILIFVISYWLSIYINSYIAIVIAHCISLLPYCIIQSIWLEKYINKKIQSIEKGLLI